MTVMRTLERRSPPVVAGERALCLHTDSTAEPGDKGMCEIVDEVQRICRAAVAQPLEDRRFNDSGCGKSPGP